MAPKSDKNTQSNTHALLSRAHSPDSTQRIFTEKIQHRPLLLRPSSPPPNPTFGPGPDARQARRVARRKAQSTRSSKRRADGLKPEPLSARDRRRKGLYDIPKDKQTYALFEPLHTLWCGYIREILGNELFTGGQACAAKLASADIHGAKVRVSRSSCPSRVGIEGIVVRDSRYAVQIITRNNVVKLVPKEGSWFRVEVPVPEVAAQAHQDNDKAEDTDNAKGVQQKEEIVKDIFTFEILGDQFQTRSADRANRKFRAHFLDKL